jgi:hypothetical protein
MDTVIALFINFTCLSLSATLTQAPQPLHVRPPFMDQSCFPFLLCVTVFLVHYYMGSLSNAMVPKITTGQSALLALKGGISYDPHNILTSNLSISISVCN